MAAGTLDNLFGVEVSTDTATTWVQAIGWFEIAVAAVMVLMLIGNFRAKGALHEFAYGRTALAIYAWAGLWGSVTAASRLTAAGELYPEIWDLVERARTSCSPRRWCTWCTRTDSITAARSSPSGRC